MCSRLHLTPSGPTSSVHPYHPQQVSSYPLINVLTIFKCFMGGIQVESCYLLYQSHVINKQHSNDLLLISRFTKQFPSNDFHKHFICLKLLIKLYILLCMFHFKLIYNCVSNKCFFILKLFYQTHAFKPFYRLTSSRSFLR